MNFERDRLYRIFTEDKGNLHTIASLVFSGFSIYPVQGYWNGIEEKSVCIEIVTNSEEFVKGLAQLIKKKNKQEYVLVQRVDLYSCLV
jgi:hypothetical protein